jgi:hypothetical protein
MTKLTTVASVALPFFQTLAREEKIENSEVRRPGAGSRGRAGCHPGRRRQA